MSSPAVSVIVVCRNERSNIRRSLESLLAQDYGGDFEILAVDGRSEDGTREIVEALAREDAAGRLRLVDNAALTIAAGRNRGLEAARFPLVAFTDADCFAPPGWLSSLVAGYAATKTSEPALVAVGGGNSVPLHAGTFARAVGIARSNFWGNHGSVQGRIFRKAAFVDHLPTVNALYEREALTQAGGFDESFGSIGEDVDLSFRLRARGRCFAYMPGTQVEHTLVTGWRAWLRKMIVYGQGRAWVLAKHGIGSGGVLFLIPLLFVLHLIVAIPLGFWWRPAWILPGIYLGATAFAALHAGVGARSVRSIPLVYAVYLMTHIPYGMGQIAGFLRPRHRTRWVRL